MKKRDKVKHGKLPNENLRIKAIHGEAVTIELLDRPKVYNIHGRLVYDVKVVFVGSLTKA